MTFPFPRFSVRAKGLSLLLTDTAVQGWTTSTPITAGHGTGGKVLLGAPASDRFTVLMMPWVRSAGFNRGITGVTLDGTAMGLLVRATASNYYGVDCYGLATPGAAIEAAPVVTFNGTGGTGAQIAVAAYRLTGANTTPAGSNSGIGGGLDNTGIAGAVEIWAGVNDDDPGTMVFTSAGLVADIANENSFGTTGTCSVYSGAGIGTVDIPNDANQAIACVGFNAA